MTQKTLSLLTATLLLTTLNAEETLQDITVVSANKTEQSIQNTTSNITVISAEDIEENGYTTVSEALNTVAGISVANAGGIGQQTSFFMRGADSGKVLVLLDGMRLNDPSTTNGTALLESLTTDSIERIEVLKGGASSIWGSNASAGVINIITKKSKTNGAHGSLGVRYGSYKTRGADLNIGYKNDTFNAQLMSSILDTDGFSAKKPRSAEKDGYKNRTYNLSLGYTFDANNQMNFSYNRIKTETEYDGGYPIIDPNDSTSKSDSDQTNIALDHTFHLDNYTAILHASKSKYERKYPYGKYEADLREYSLINKYQYNNGKAIVGFEYKDIDGVPGEGYANKAIFLSNVYHINKNTLLETNLRYDNFDNFTNKTTYKLGVKHSPDLLNGLTIAGNYYTAFDAPSAYQIANVATAIGVTLLKPAFTKGYELSIGYKDLLNLTYFQNKVKDSFDYYSDWDADYNDGDGYYNISGSSKFSGLEVQSILPLNEIFTLTTNYTHLIKYQKDDGSKFDKRAKDTLNLMLDAYIDDNTHYGINTQYIGDRKEFGHNTGNYTLWNIHFDTKIMDDVDVAIHAKNIFDKDYQSVYGYATAGRTIDVKVKYSF